jgi:hypothetical protein
MAMVAELREISRKERSGENWLLFTATLSRACSALKLLLAENGVE